MKPIKRTLSLTNEEYNAVEVAIDHLVEHLTDSLADSFEDDLNLQPRERGQHRRRTRSAWDGT